jgi:hypothetical protein
MMIQHHTGKATPPLSASRIGFEVVDCPCRDESQLIHENDIHWQSTSTHSAAGGTRFQSEYVINAGRDNKGSNQMSVTATGFCCPGWLNAEPIEPNQVKTRPTIPANASGTHRMELDFIHPSLAAALNGGSEEAFNARR